MTGCLLSHVARAAGCHLDWVGGEHPDHRSCSSKDDILRYQAELASISKLRWIQLTNVTKCFSKCSYRQFFFEKVWCLSHISSHDMSFHLAY